MKSAPALTAQGARAFRLIWRRWRAPRADRPHAGRPDPRREACWSARIDPVNGGIGDAPKFANAPIFRFLWNELFRRGDGAGAPTAVGACSTRLCQGGSTTIWGRLRPLLDRRAMARPAFREDALRQRANSRIARSGARRGPRLALYAARARETVDWLVREMLSRGRRLRRFAGRRPGRRGRAVLRLDRAGDRRRPWPVERGFQGGL